MLTPSQAKHLETFARHVTVVEAPIGASTPAMTHAMLADLGHEHVIDKEWAYSLFIEIGTNRDNAQGYGATVMTSERSMAALSECIARFWQSLLEEGVFHAPQSLSIPS